MYVTLGMNPAKTVTKRTTKNHVVKVVFKHRHDHLVLYNSHIQALNHTLNVNLALVTTHQVTDRTNFIDIAMWGQ